MQAEATSSSQPEEPTSAEREELSTSAAAEEPSSSSAMFVPPHKKKGKALRDVIARKEAQESSQPQDSRAVDVSAYTDARPAEVEAKPSTSTSPPPVATPDRQTEAPKVGFLLKLTSRVRLTLERGGFNIVTKGIKVLNNHIGMFAMVVTGILGAG